MKKAIFVLLFAASGLRTSAADTVPAELVGEWRNSTNKIEYCAIYLFSEGTGALLASDKGDTLGGKIRATYNPKTHTLTVTTLLTRQEGGRQTYHLDYDPTAKTLISRKSELGKKPFTRRSLKVPSYIKEELQ